MIFNLVDGTVSETGLFSETLHKIGSIQTYCKPVPWPSGITWTDTSFQTNSTERQTKRRKTFSDQTVQEVKILLRHTRHAEIKWHEILHSVSIHIIVGEKKAPEALCLAICSGCVRQIWFFAEEGEREITPPSNPVEYGGSCRDT